MAHAPLGWLAAAEGRNVAIGLVAFVAPLELVASVLGSLARDAVAGTGMGVLSGSWLCIGLVLLGSPPGSTSDALGVPPLVCNDGPGAFSNRSDRRSPRAGSRWDRDGRGTQ